MAGKAAEMGKSKVIKLLELFPDIDEEIKARRSIVNDLEGYYDTSESIQYDGMPRRNYHVGSPTEKRAMNIPDYVHKEITLYQKEIEALQQVKVEILKEISRLKLKQKKVIFGFYFHGLKWEEVAERTNYSDRQCKNIRDEALGNLLIAFSKNRVLIDFLNF